MRGARTKIDRNIPSNSLVSQNEGTVSRGGASLASSNEATTLTLEKKENIPGAVRENFHGQLI